MGEGVVIGQTDTDGERRLGGIIGTQVSEDGRNRVARLLSAPAPLPRFFDRLEAK